MKNFIKYVILGLLALMASFSYAQIVPTVVNGGVVTISGKGKIGGTKDGAQWRRYKFARSGSFYLSAYFRSLSNSNNSFTGIAFRNESNASKTDGGIPCIGLYLENDTLKLKVKAPADTRFVDMAILPGVKAPCGLKIVKDGNNFLAYYTTSAESSTAPNYQLLSTINNAFNSGWNTITQNFCTGSRLGSVATALVTNIAFAAVTETNTNPCTNGGTFDLVSITKTTGNLYDVSFNAAGLYNVNIDVKNASNVSVRNYSTGVNANPLSVDVGTLPSGTYTMKFTGESCSGTASKTFTVTNSVVPAPVIASVPLIPVAGSSVTFTSTGCSGTVNWYRNNVSNGIQGASASLTVASPTASSVYFAKCVISGVESVGSNVITVVQPTVQGTASVGFVPNLAIANYSYWNYFNPDDVPNSTTPETLDSKTGQILPNKWFIWHAPYRNLFGINDSELSRLTKMVNKGITAWNVSKLPAYSTTYANVVTPKRFVAETYGLGINGGNPHPEEANYTTFGNYAKGGVSSAATWNMPFVGGKYDILASIVDYENLHTSLTTQTASNYHTVAFEEMASISKGRVGFQYGAGLNTGGYYTSALYNGSNNVWGLAADNTVPSGYIGKSASSNNRTLGVLEITYAYEAFLPENYQVQDQNNVNWFNIRHFGSELDNTYTNTTTANAQHWASNVGVGVETMYNLHKSYPNGGQDVIAQLKPVNETDNGYHYDQRYAAFRGNKYANYVNRYGITHNINGTETLIATGSEYLPNFMAEGQIELAYFCGAKGINFWSSDFSDIAIPKAKTGNPQRGAKYNDVNYGNRDLANYTHTLKALWRLNQKVTLSDGRQFSFNDICDGTEVYLNQNTKVIYPNSSAVTTLRALDWQLLKRSPVRAVVNVAKNVAFVIAFQAYGVEDASVRFIYNTNGANVDETISLPVGEIIMKAFPLTGNVNQGGSAAAPVIQSNPVNPVAGVSVVFSTSSACAGGTIKWYNADVQMGTGTSYTVSSPLVNNSYSATCTVGSSVSSSSNLILIAANTSPSSVIITEPAKSQYYFSNGQAPAFYSNRSNLPAIITNTSTFDAVNDIVYLQNSEVKYGINLKRGGQLCYASLAGSSDNLIFNGYDGGFQVVLDATQILDPANIGGQTSGSPQNNNAYNTTMGGDYLNHSQTLIDYHSVGSNGYYVKFRPLLYPFNALNSEVEIEVTYTLIGKALKIEYNYVSFRTDGHYPLNPTAPSGLKGWAVPVCFLVEKLNKYQTYTGSSPWNINSPVEEGQIPNTTPGQGGGAILGKETKEFWGLSYNQTENLGLGAMNVSEGGSSGYMTWEQREKYAGNPQGSTFGTGGRTVMDILTNVLVPDGGNFQKSTTAYVVVGSPTEIRNTFYTMSGH